MSDQTIPPRLEQNALTLGDVTFFDKDGATYTPSTVEKKITTNNGDTIVVNWSTIAGFTSGDDIFIPATQLVIQDTTLVREKHVIVIAGDRGASSENRLRVIVSLINAEKVKS